MINVDKHKDKHDLQQITEGFYRFSRFCHGTIK